MRGGAALPFGIVVENARPFHDGKEIANFSRVMVGSVLVSVGLENIPCLSPVSAPDRSPQRPSCTEKSTAEANFFISIHRAASRENGAPVPVALAPAPSHKTP